MNDFLKKYVLSTVFLSFFLHCSSTNNQIKEIKDKVEPKKAEQEIDPEAIMPIKRTNSTPQVEDLPGDDSDSVSLIMNKNNFCELKQNKLYLVGGYKLPFYKSLVYNNKQFYFIDGKQCFNFFDANICLQNFYISTNCRDKEIYFLNNNKYINLAKSELNNYMVCTNSNFDTSITNKGLVLKYNNIFIRFIDHLNLNLYSEDPFCIILSRNK